MCTVRVCFCVCMCERPPVRRDDLSIPVPKFTCQVSAVVKSLHRCLFHLLVIHKQLPWCRNYRPGARSHLQENDRKQTSNYDEKSLQLTQGKRHHLSNVQIKNRGGPRWVIICAALWLVRDESPSWRGGKCLEGKGEEERGRRVICWFMATLSGGCLRQTVIKMKLSPWWKRRGICHDVCMFWKWPIWKGEARISRREATYSRKQARKQTS